MISVELVDGCQLKCALCWNRNRKPSFRQMTLETVEKVLSKYRNSTQDIAWFNWGEPLLYKEFVTHSQMIKGTNSILSSNLSLDINDAHLEAFSNYKTFYLSVSGMTKDVYGIYNCGGNFDLVMKNIHKISEIKHPRIFLRWQSHKYNEHQKNEAKDFAEKMGFTFDYITLNCEVEELLEGFDHELLKNPRCRKIPTHNCLLLNWTFIDVDGYYLLCCTSHNVKIGYHINDNPHMREMIDAKNKQGLCVICRKNNYWKMF